jgi:secondary thiamine-phosphate synthase enzyme
MLSENDWLLDAHDCPGFLKSEVTSHLEKNGQIHHTEVLYVNIPSRYALVNITDICEKILKNSKVSDGLCFISAMHITAGIYVNDAESGLLQDIAKWINKLAPYGENYKHHHTGEDNGDAHLKSFLTNHFCVVPITQGSFDFGTWQQIFYAEYDGQRKKRILVKIMGI